MTKISVDDVYKYDRCLESYAGHGLPPCQDICDISRRTVCMKIRSKRKNIEKNNK